MPRRKPHSQRKSANSHDYASLEDRQVLSANPIVSLSAGGLLSVQGTDQADIVHLRENNDQILVHVKAGDNRVDTYSFDADDVDRIYFAGGNGDDYFANCTTFESTAYGNQGRDTLVGGESSDTLRGGDGDDILKGLGGDDSLHGDHGNDRLFGHEGNDRLLGWYGDDILVGMEGDDYVSGYLGNDILFGNEGDDVVKGHEGDDRIRGGEGDDELYGWKGNDRIFGEGGDDYISGYWGDDILSGAAGDDVLKGHEGNDRIFGGEGDDLLYGWKGDDIMNGGDGNDELWGGDDNDLLVGWNGNDILHGDHGNDRLYGSDGDDVLIGYYGNDRIVGGAGADMLCGGQDDDTYVGIGSEDVGYDPNGDFINSPGADSDKLIQAETWAQFDQIMEEFQAVSDKIAVVVQTDGSHEKPDIAVDDNFSTKLYVTDSNGNLSSYDTASNEYEDIGKLDVRLTDIAMSADGELYGVSFNTLYAVDVENADLQRIGSVGRGDLNALTFTDDGQLLAAGFAGSHVYSVNLDTAQLTSIGTFNGRSSGDLTVHNDQLFVTTSSGSLQSLDFNSNGTLGSSTHVGSVNSLAYGLASQGDTLFATVGSNLYEVDDQNGNFTSVSNLGSYGVSNVYGITEGVS